MKRILLVEDNEDNRIIYRTLLEYAGYAVLECADGAAAIRCAREERPDLILMDIALPKINGWDATRILKADPTTRRIPILALTAHALMNDRERAKEIGFDGFLPKPIAPRRVLEEVEAVLGIKLTAA